MTAVEACELLVDHVRLVSRLRAEAAAYRQLAIEAIHYAHKVTGERDRLQRWRIEEREQRRQLTTARPAVEAMVETTSEGVVAA